MNSASDRQDERVAIGFAGCVVITIAALVVGTVLMLGWEWVFQRIAGRSTVPTLRSERAYIVLQLVAWSSCCGVVAALSKWLWRRGITRFAGREDRAWNAAAAAWLLGLVLILATLKTSGVLLCALLSALLFANCLTYADRLRQFAGTGLLFPSVLSLWAMTMIDLGDIWAGVQFVAVALVAGGTIGLLDRRAAAQPGTRWVQLALVAVVLALAGSLDLIRFGWAPAAEFTAALAYAASFRWSATSTEQRLRVTWLLTGAASVLLGWVAGLGPATDMVRQFVAGVALTLLGHGCGVRFREPIARVVREVPAPPIGVLLVLVLGGVAVFVLPMFGVLALGVSLAFWNRIGVESQRRQEPALTRTESQFRRRMVWLMAACAVAARVLFWVLTDRVWEDTLITIQHAENAVRGLGLTHHPAHGRIHGFTSAISVLIPLAGEWLHAGGALPALRVAGIVAAGLTVFLAAQLADHPGLRLSTPGLFLWLAYLALDHSQIAFGMSGMETQVWTCVLIAGAWAFAYRRPVLLGVALAGAELCRPDALPWVALCWFAALGLGVRRALMVVAISVLGVLPWLTFTWWYYGSPVPNTMLAKAAGYVWLDYIPVRGSSFVEYVLFEMRAGLRDLLAIVSPNFRGHGLGPIATVPAPELVQRAVSFVGAMGLVRLARGTFWPIPVYAIGFAAYIVLIVQYWFPWYPIAALGLCALIPAAGLDTFEHRRSSVRMRVGQWSVAAAIAACYIVPLPWTFASEARVQELVENRVRKAVGLWLRDHAHPDEYVAAECLGYLGYYSRLPFHDYPGLSSPTVVALVRGRGANERPGLNMVVKLRPEWLALRKDELGAATADYEQIEVFTMPEQDRQALSDYLPIGTWDHEFHIFRRRDRGP